MTINEKRQLAIMKLLSEFKLKCSHSLYKLWQLIILLAWVTTHTDALKLNKASEDDTSNNYLLTQFAFCADTSNNYLLTQFAFLIF